MDRRTPICNSLKYAESNLAKRFGLDELAKSAGYSVPQFSRIFSKYCGITPMRYVNMLRILEAARLISESNMPITEIAFECGFDSLEVFERGFKRYFRIAPVDYRRFKGVIAPAPFYLSEKIFYERLRNSMSDGGNSFDWGRTASIYAASRNIYPNNFFETLNSLGVGRDGKKTLDIGSMTDFLRKQMDMAHMKAASGVTDYNTAIRQACKALSDSGLRTVYYASGRSDRIEVAVRRALMTSVSQVTQRISEQNAEEFGADGWEISAHAGARPSHAIYQGRQYPNSKYELIVRPLIEDYNCRHSAFPIIMGVSQPAYTEEELKNIDPPPFTYQGRTYTAYQAQQQMRKMERAMRKQKDRCITAEAAGDKDAFTAASIKLRRQKDIYEDFCKAAGTYTEYERTFIQGYDRHLAGKTGAVTRKQNAFKNAQVTLTNSGNGGIIKAGSDKVALEYQRYGRNKSTLVNKTYIDSGEYRRKFDQLTDNPEVNRIIYSKAKEMLKHRSGTKIEDMYWIDGDTGEIVASALNEKGESSVRYTEAIHKAIIGRKNLIAMHTHPQSLPPSDADFNSVVRYGYSKALVLCHDGKIFQYTANETINGALYDAYVQRFLNEGSLQFDAQIRALKKISENCDIDFWEVE